MVVNNKMVVAVGTPGGDLLVRIDPDRHDELTSLPGAATGEMGAGRAMGPGWVSVTEESLGDEHLPFWINVALEYNARVVARSR